MQLLLRLSLSIVNSHRVMLWFLMQFIHRWVEYCGTLEANSSMTSRFWVALIYSKIRRALCIGQWFVLNLYLWLWRTGLAPCEVLTLLVQCQWLKDHNFWLQWCSVAAQIVYNFEGLSRNDSRPFSMYGQLVPSTVNGLLLTGYIVLPILI